MAQDQVRIGVIGGGFGAGFQWRQHPQCVVGAVSDLVPDRRNHLMQRYQCETTYDTLEAMLQDDSLDAIAVFSGAPDHVRHSVATMNAGKHCLCAVPAAMTLEECAALIEAKERNGVRYMMAETSYYRWETILMRDLYTSGEFGEIIYSEVEYYHPLPHGHPERQRYWWDAEGRPTWRHGYAPLLYPTHSTGFLVGVTKERLVEVSAMGHIPPDDPVLSRGDNQYGNPFGSESALCRTDRGNLCRCNVMYGIHASGERAQWFGERAAAFMATSSGQPFVVKREGEPDITQLPDYWTRLPEPLREVGGHGNSHPFLTHEFVSAIIEDREPAIDVYESVAMTAPGIVAHQSALRGGERLSVPSFDRKPGDE